MKYRVALDIVAPNDFMNPDEHIYEIEASSAAHAISTILGRFDESTITTRELRFTATPVYDTPATRLRELKEATCKTNDIDMLAMSLIKQGVDVSDLFSPEKITAYQARIDSGE